MIDFRRDGADADFVAVQADELVPKPATATHAEAAAVPLSALTAWQALFDQGDLAPWPPGARPRWGRRRRLVRRPTGSMARGARDGDQFGA